MSTISISTQLKRVVATAVKAKVFPNWLGLERIYLGFHGNFTNDFTTLSSILYGTGGTAPYTSWPETNLTTKSILSGSAANSSIINANGDLELYLNTLSFANVPFVNHGYATPTTLQYFSIVSYSTSTGDVNILVGTVGDQYSTADIKIVDNVWDNAKTYSITDPLVVHFPTTFTG
jgi:hypothetical protein